MMAIMLSVFLLDIICVAMCNRYQNKFEITPAQFSSDGTADRIHFLNTYYGTGPHGDFCAQHL